MFKKIECPFDLESIFTLQFNTSGLKSVLEFILEHIGTLDEQTAEHYSAFLKAKPDIDRHSADIEATKKSVGDVRAQATEQDKRLTETAALITTSMKVVESNKCGCDENRAHSD